MAALLTKLIPFRDWLYAGAFLALIAFGAYERNRLIDEGEAKERADLTASSNALQAENAKKIAALVADHEAQLEKVESNYAAQTKADAATHSADADRLREYDAYRHSHQTVSCAAAKPGASKPGGSGSGGNGDRFEQLEQVASELADAGRGLENALTACLSERASLTGK